MLPVFFKIGLFEVRSFGVMMLIAFLCALWLALRRAEKYGFTKAQVMDAAFWVLLAGILGARLGFILQELPDFLKHPDKLFTLKFEGLTSFGGVIFGFFALWLYSRKLGRGVTGILDVMAAPFLVGHIFGRIGCLLNGCCYGGPVHSNVPWAIHVNVLNENPATLHHPAQIYDSLMNVGGLILLLLLERKPRAPGQSFGLMLVFYGMARIIYEMWRAGASSTYWGSLPFTQAQAMAALLVLVGLAMFFIQGYRFKPIEVRTESP